MSTMMPPNRPAAAPVFQPPERAAAAPPRVLPAAEVSNLLVTQLDATRIRIAWDPSADPCHGSYRVYGVPASVRGEKGCFAQLVDLTPLDEDMDTTNTVWFGPGSYFGYLVIDQAPGGGKGPLGHFRR